MTTIPQLLRMDGLANAITGLGHTAYDPILGDQLFSSTRTLTREQQDEYVLRYGLLKKCVTNIPTAATSNFGKPTLAEGDPKQVAAIDDFLRKIPVTVLSGQIYGWERLLRGGVAKSGLRKAIYYQSMRAFKSGNGAILIDVDDGRRLDEPIDYGNIRSIRRLWVASRWQVVPHLWRVDDQTGTFSHFQSLYSNELFHSSRVLWTPGIAVDPDSDVFMTNQGCDLSILEPIVDAFRMYYTGVRGAARMITDFDVIVHKIEGLLADFRNDQNRQYEQAITERARVNMKSRSVYRGMLIDKDREEITHDTRQAGGYSDLLIQLKNHLLASTDYPPAVLFGEFSSGLDATGKSTAEKQLINETISRYQRTELEDLLMGDTDDHKGLLPIICLAKNGPTGGKMPTGLGWQWEPVYEPSREEDAEYELTRSQIITTYASLDPRITASGILELGQGSAITLTKEYQDQLQKEAELKEPPGGEQAQEEPLLEEPPLEGEAEVPAEVPAEEGTEEWEAELAALLEGQQDSADPVRRPVRRIRRFHGFEIGVTHQPFSKRHGKVLPIGYGHLRRTRGEDGKAVDVYIGPFLDSTSVSKVRQITPDGKFDEWKFFVGFLPHTTLVDIEDLYLGIMPADRYGGAFPSSLAELEQYRVSGETRADAASLRSDQLIKNSCRKALREYRGLNKQRRKMVGVKRSHYNIGQALLDGTPLNQLQRREMKATLKAAPPDSLPYRLMGGAEQAKRVRFDSEPGGSEAKGKPCGASYISQAYECRVGQSKAAQRSERFSKAMALADTIDPKKALEDAPLQERAKQVAKLADSDPDAADALDSQPLPAFKSNDDQQRLVEVLRSADDPETALEMIFADNWSTSSLNRRRQEAAGYLQVLDDFGVDSIDDLYDADYTTAILDPQAKLPKIPGIDQVRDRVLQYDNPAETLEYLQEAASEGWSKRDYKSAAQEIRAETGDEADPIAQMYDQLADDQPLRQAIAKVQGFDPESLNTGDFEDAVEAQAALERIELASHPNLRKFGKGLPSSMEEQDERIYAWLDQQLQQEQP